MTLPIMMNSISPTVSPRGQLKALNSFLKQPIFEIRQVTLEQLAELEQSTKVKLKKCGVLTALFSCYDQTKNQ